MALEFPSSISTVTQLLNFWVAGRYVIEMIMLLTGNYSDRWTQFFFLTSISKCPRWRFDEQFVTYTNVNHYKVSGDWIIANLSPQSRLSRDIVFGSNSSKSICIVFKNTIIVDCLQFLNCFSVHLNSTTFKINEILR